MLYSSKDCFNRNSLHGEETGSNEKTEKGDHTNLLGVSPAIRVWQRLIWMYGISDFGGRTPSKTCLSEQSCGLSYCLEEGIISKSCWSVRSKTSKASSVRSLGSSLEVDQNPE